MVAGPAVVVRMGTARPLECRTAARGRVDVQMQPTMAMATQVGQALLGHQALRVVDGHLVEPTLVAVIGIEAVLLAASQSHEEAIGGPALQPEDTILADACRVHHEPKFPASVRYSPNLPRCIAPDAREIHALVRCMDFARVGSDAAREVGR